MSKSIKSLGPITPALDGVLAAADEGRIAQIIGEIPPSVYRHLPPKGDKQPNITINILFINNSTFKESLIQISSD